MGSDAVCERRLKYAASLSPASCSRKEGRFDDAFDDDDSFHGVHAYIQVEVCLVADADWIPDSDDSGENASTLQLLALSIIVIKNINISDDDEGEEKGLMM
jgi:hypothetical protein